MPFTSSCILFIKVGTSLASGPPPQIESLIKNRIQTQYAARYPTIDLQFDKATENTNDCSVKGAYELRDDSVVLRAENLVWPGERSYALNDLLDGRQLDFPAPLIEIGNSIDAAALAKAPPERPKWIVPALVGGGIALVAGVLIHNLHHASTAASSNEPTRVTTFR